LNIGGIEKIILSSHAIKRGDGHFVGHPNIHILTPLAEEVVTIKIDTSGLENLVWPNREGEKITNFGIDRDYVLTYPASASMRAFLLQGPQGGILLGAKVDNSGRITKISLTPKELTIKANPTDWFIGSYTGNRWQEIAEKYGNFSMAPDRPRITNNSHLYQVQVGLIDSDGNTEVGDEGFLVLSDIAKTMREEIGEGNILHVFGWAGGHDKDYPIYQPNEKLGGYQRLGQAVKAVHDNGQKVVLYINARLASSNIVEMDDELQKAVLRDSKGIPICESYNGNDFYVMDPSSEAWIDTLLEVGRNLVPLNIDGLELDQVAYQYAAGRDPGEKWGCGYQRLIKSLQSFGFKIWTEGVSDLYETQYQQLTNRWKNPQDVIVLSTGEVYKGLPLGEYYPEFFMSIHGGRGDISYPLAKFANPEQFREIGATIVEINDDDFNPLYRPPSKVDRGYLDFTVENIKYCQQFL